MRVRRVVVYIIPLSIIFSGEIARQESAYLQIPVLPLFFSWRPLLYTPFSEPACRFWLVPQTEQFSELLLSEEPGKPLVPGFRQQAYTFSVLLSYLTFLLLFLFFIPHFVCTAAYIKCNQKIFLIFSKTFRKDVYYEHNELMPRQWKLPRKQRLFVWYGKLRSNAEFLLLRQHAG